MLVYFTGGQYAGHDGPQPTAAIEIIACNHGGFYSVHDWAREQHMLGQVQKMSRGNWAARRHGQYRDSNPPIFATRREAVAFLKG
jgi:hypothetical protein